MKPGAIQGRRRRPSAALELLLVACGAAPGALLRWHLEHAVVGVGAVGLAGPVLADLLANLLGSLLLGLVVAQQSRRPRLQLLLGIGFCGALTTFSSWILHLQRLLSAGSLLPALLLLVVSLLGGLAALLAGFALAGGLRR
jgi:CrcB protein